MTANQIAYQRNLEERRSNLIQERETRRSNLARESETNRHNLTQEQHSLWDIQRQVTRDNNWASLEAKKQNELVSHNRAMEANQMYANSLTAQRDQYNYALGLTSAIQSDRKLANDAVGLLIGGVNNYAQNQQNAQRSAQEAEYRRRQADQRDRELDLRERQLEQSGR